MRLAIDEDVDLIGISSLSTDHLIIPGLMRALHSAALDHVRVVVGGIVPNAERALLIDSPCCHSCSMLPTSVGCHSSV